VHGCVGPEWSHNMAHALALDPRTWPREDVPGLGLINEDVDLLMGGVCDIPAQGLIGLIRILIPISCNFFSESPSQKNSKVKRAWLGAMGGRPGSPSRVRMSEDKVRRKDMCWSVGIFLGS
jgi:hypothetical protein